jgi:hypothetical protein
MKSVYLMTDEEATKRSEDLLRLMPEQWRVPTISSHDLEGIKENKELLKEITRAVPLKLLLDHTKGSLPAASDKSALTTSHFFLSTPVSKLGAFVSHRWSASPTETVSALIMHMWFAGGPGCCGIPPVIVLVMGILFLVQVIAIIFPPAMAAVVPFISFVFYAIMHASGSECVLWMLGYSQPKFWFDKATVHQTKNPLTQAGLHLFSHYLKQSGELLILFQPEYLTRVWCVYEFAWWLKEKEAKNIALVPLNTYNALCRSVSNAIPSVIFLLCCAVALLLSAFMFAIKWALIFIGRDLLMVALAVVWLCAMCVIVCVVTCFVTSILAPAKTERLKIAEQLRRFEVRDTQAFSEADKKWVLGQICQWWRSEQGEMNDEGALDAFNDYMRTSVAKKLNELQLQRERTLSRTATLIGSLFGIVIAVYMLLGVGYIPALAWPRFEEDFVGFLMTDQCAIYANVGHLWEETCTPDHGVGVANAFAHLNLSCLDGEYVHNYTGAGCAGAYSSSAIVTWLIICAVYVGVALLFCICARGLVHRDPLVPKKANKSRVQAV